MNRDEFLKSIGEAVRRKRLAAGLTQEQLAECVSRSSVYISEIERGRRNPSIIVLTDIADAIQTDVRDFLVRVPTGCNFESKQNLPPRAQ